MTQILSVVLSIAISAIAQTAKPVDPPDTAPGRIVKAYVKAFNSGDEQAMRDFFASNVSASSLAQRPIEARLAVYREMRGNMVAIEIRRVLAARDAEVVVLVQTKRGDWFEFGFQFETAAPHKLMGLRVQDSDAPAAAAEVDTLPATMTEAQLVETLDKHLSQAVAADEFSGTVLVAKNNTTIFQKACGLASKEFNVPNRVDTKFNLGSINKIFTQIAIGQLVEQGKLSFDDKLGKHLPDYPNHDAAEKVTIRQLLDMKSGIGDFFGSEFEATPKNKLRTVKDFLPLFANKALQFEPGTRQQYSNGGYIVLGAIVEKVSGQDYYDYVREHIFKSADMQNTDWYEADLVTANLASGYTTEGNATGVRRNNLYSRPAKGSPAGGGYSTAPDLLKFVAALREGKLRVPDFRNQQSPVPAPARFRGLGIAGGAPGINAALEADEDKGYTIIVMSNYDPPSAERMARQVRGWISRVKN
ncbi:MAG TPA: serine hydrolase domain-containing protein [Blastocatellia bacterium]|nr:serine hydrolase domain-containing protein [Blastocatellia bacterium]